MLSLVRRLIRRTPPHLRGRIPVDAGVGVAVGDGLPQKTVEAIQVHGGDVETNRESHARREYEQAPLLANGARPDWAMRAAQQQRGLCGHHDSMGLPLSDTAIWMPEATGCGCAVRPSPAQNAQRYSKPEWTW